MSAGDTIYALATAPGRAGVAVLRISGPQAGAALTALTGKALPAPRLATLRRLIDPQDGDALDQALLLWFPGPASFTGEDVAELHLHGGRAVIAGITAALSRLPGLRPADAGE
ncbi:MAG TPA: tRNA uridine-5-carboxymethylaminomethyl(34) synthesis GTPase MnmE, partial [Azospirillaceae bacterium]|nr:tRNA uridine-5-carboxymethylaminomethyl(34) synthesis GTPase MnmE [Azospirillaceae bacterium]